MADNLFKDSNPGCGVPEVPVVTFDFVEDCFIKPTPPPIFECVQPPVPNEPCINCPEFESGGTIAVGFAGDGCPAEPRLDIVVTKTGDDPCKYDFSVDLEIPIPRVPCPEINVNKFTVDTYPDPPCPDTEIPDNRFVITTRHRPPVDCTDPGGCAFDIDLEIGVPVPIPPCPEINVTNFNVRTALIPTEVELENCSTFTIEKQSQVSSYRDQIKPGDSIFISNTNKRWRYVPGHPDSVTLDGTPGFLACPCPQEECQSSFVITKRTSGGCDGENASCEFDVDLDLCIPIPKPPCPTFTITNFGVRRQRNSEENCEARFTVDNVGDISNYRDEYEKGDYVKVGAGSTRYRYMPDDPDADEVGDVFGFISCPCEPCGSKFSITQNPKDCGEDESCEFNVELDICVPEPPCPTFTITNFSVRRQRNSEENCEAKFTVNNVSNISDYRNEYEEGDYVKVGTGSTRYRYMPNDPNATIVGGVAGFIRCDCEPCGSSFSITRKDPQECGEDENCDFNVELDICVPEPPCPTFTVTNFSVRRAKDARKDCETKFTAATEENVADYEYEKGDYLLLESKLVSVGGILTNKRVDEIYRYVPDDPAAIVLGNIPGFILCECEPCGSKFSITKKDPQECGEDENCDFNVELDICVPEPPCPTFTITNFSVRRQRNTEENCEAKFIVNKLSDISDYRNEYREGDYVKVASSLARYRYMPNDPDAITIDNVFGFIPCPCQPPCGSSFSITRADPDGCGDDENCDFNVALDICVPEPPCPTFTITNFSVRTVTKRQNEEEELDCEAQFSVRKISDLAQYKDDYQNGDYVFVGFDDRDPDDRDVLLPDSDDWDVIYQRYRYMPEDPDREVLGGVDGFIKCPCPAKPCPVNSTIEKISDISNWNLEIPFQEGEYIVVVLDDRAPGDPSSFLPHPEDWKIINRRYRYTLEGAGREVLDGVDGFVPAPCDECGSSFSISKKNPKDCGEDENCDFDVNLDICVPIPPPPPCPRFDIKSFNVRTAKRNLDENGDEEITCPDFTVNQKEDIAEIVDELQPGDYVLVEYDNREPPRKVDDYFRYAPDDPDSFTVGCVDGFIRCECPKPCQSTFKIERSNVKDCDEDEDQCKFDVTLDICVPEQCPKFNITEFDVVVSNPDGDDCQSDITPDVTVNTECERDELMLAEAELDTIVYVVALDKYFRRTAGEGCPEWVEVKKCASGSKFTIQRHVENCETGDEENCEFDIELRIEVPQPPCPKININSFSVTSQFTNDDDDCCQDDVPEEDIITVNCLEDLAALSTTEAPVGSIARIVADGDEPPAPPEPGACPGSNPDDPPCTKPECGSQYWKRVREGGTVENPDWEPTAPPAKKCENKFTITTCHRAPNGNDPGQCEFNVDLAINVPIPKPPCPTITGEVTTTVGFADSVCTGCGSDAEVESRADLVNVPNPTEGMYVKVRSIASTYEYVGGAWIPKNFENTEYTPYTSWADAPADPADGTAAVFEFPPKKFIARNSTFDSGIETDGGYQFYPRWDFLGGETAGSEHVFDNFAALNAWVAAGGDGELEAGTVVGVTNPPYFWRYTAPTAANFEGPHGWLGTNGNLPPTGDINITNEDPLNTLTPDVGTVAVVARPSDRFQYRDGAWYAAPCPKNKFTVRKREEPGDCNNPGSCAFELDLELNVPVPKPPCPEINVKTFAVSVVDQTCAEADPERCKNRFEITAQKLSGRITNRLENQAELEALAIPGGAEIGDLVAVKNPNYTGAEDSDEPEFTYWRAVRETSEDGPHWTQVEGTESCPGELDGGDTCSFDVELELCVPIPSPECPEININTFTVKSIPELCALENPELCKNRFEIATRHETNFVKEIYDSVAELNAVQIPEDVKVGELVAVKNPDYPGDPGSATPEFIYWRAIKKTSEVPGPYWREVDIAELCDASNKCIFDIDLEICVPIACPEFIPRLKVKSFYDYGKDSCNDCDNDYEITRGQSRPANAAIGETLGIRDDDGRLVSRLRRVAAGWVPAPCDDSALIITARPPESCEDGDTQCKFDVVLDISVPVPVPPCPTFNSRQHRVEVCDTNFPRSSLEMHQRETDCDEEKRCVFDIDFNLEIPCPTFSGNVDVNMTGFGGPQGGSINVSKQACNARPPEIECEEPDYTVADTVARDKKFAELLAQLGPAAVVGVIIKTEQPTPQGALWRVLSVTPANTAEWFRIVCDSEPQNTCAFDIDLSLQIPGCRQIEFIEDDELGTFTGIPRAEKLKIFYLLEDDECPKPEGCIDPADIPVNRNLPNLQALDALRGDEPGIPAGVGYRLADGQVFRVTAPFTGDESYIKLVKNPADRFSRNLVVQDITREQAQAGGVPIRDASRIAGGRVGIDANLGTARDPSFAPGEVFNVAGDIWEIEDAGDDVLRRVQKPPCNNDNFRVVIVPGPIPCLFVYQVQLRLCLRNQINKSKCTNYYGDQCCDDQGCSCTNPPSNPCCEDYYKEEDDVGAEYTSQPTGVFTAPDNLYVTPKELPRLSLDSDAAGANDCAGYVAEVSDQCDEPPPRPGDAGYRPFKALELNIVNKPHKDRTEPVKVEYQLDAAMNCLHGGEVFVKSKARPNTDAIDEDQLGEGYFELKNNRINLTLELYTTDCEADGGTGDSIPAQFRARPQMAATAPTLTPALLAEFISAINTNPELKAAIRNIVNQPDN